MQKKYDGPQRRQHYRIKYPLPERPELKMGGKSYQVIDLSEGGIKFFSFEDELFKGGQEIKCDITFHDGEILELEGKILRTQNKRVIILLDTKIPFKRIIKEQRYLIKKYAGFF